MGRRSQIKQLIIQEFHLAKRSRYIVISFVLLPLFMWSLQGGLQYFMMSQVESSLNSPTFQGESIYVYNADQGYNGTNYGQILKSNFTQLVTNSTSQLYGVTLRTIYPGNNLTAAFMRSMVLDKDYSPLLFINSSFSEMITTFNQTEFKPAIVDLFYGVSDRRFAQAVYNSLWGIVSQPPFQVVEQIKDSGYQMTVLAYHGEEDASQNFVFGLIGFIVLILAVMAPAPYVSSSFAGEKEKGTLEALIALPMKRIDILIAKLIFGMGLVSIFSFMNILGILLFQFILQLGGEQSDIDLYNTMDLSTGSLVLIGLMILLTSFASIGIGICIASLINDSRTAESTYTFAMLVPAMIVGMASIGGNIPSGINIQLLIPWTHSLLILYKGLYPQTYASATITGQIWLDFVIHISYLLFFVIVSLIAAARLFNRESLVN